MKVLPQDPVPDSSHLRFLEFEVFSMTCDRELIAVLSTRRQFSAFPSHGGKAVPFPHLKRVSRLFIPPQFRDIGSMEIPLQSVSDTTHSTLSYVFTLPIVSPRIASVHVCPDDP